MSVEEDVLSSASALSRDRAWRIPNTYKDSPSYSSSVVFYNTLLSTLNVSTFQ